MLCSRGIDIRWILCKSWVLILGVGVWGDEEGYGLLVLLNDWGKNVYFRSHGPANPGGGLTYMSSTCMCRSKDPPFLT